MTEAQRLADLQAREDIRSALARFARAQDLKDWNALEGMVTADVRGEYGTTVTVTGRDEFMRMHRRYLGSCGPTQHLLGNFLVEVQNGSASSHCYLRAMHAGIGRRQGDIYDLWGEYFDEWRLTEGGWRICRRIEKNFHETGDHRTFFDP